MSLKSVPNDQLRMVFQISRDFSLAESIKDVDDSFLCVLSRDIDSYHAASRGLFDLLREYYLRNGFDCDHCFVHPTRHQLMFRAFYPCSSS